MTDRQQVMLHGDPGEITAGIVRVLRQAGADGFGLRYDREGTPLAEGEEPGPADTVIWQASATFPNPLGADAPARQVTGRSRVEPGGDHARGGIKACVQLLEQLGGNVVLLDMGDRTDPRT